MDKHDLSKLNLKPCNLEEALKLINQLAGIIIELKKDNDLLREKLNNNSKNSSLPPTNNHAEQHLRPLVILKKLTFDTQSDRGSRFTERIFTVVMTCKQQSRDIFAFLVEAIEKYFLGGKSQFLTIAP